MNKVILVMLALFVSSSINAASKNSSGGFIDFNVYPYLSDVDTDNTLTINSAANLPNRLSYFSLINFGNQSESSELEDTISYYTEQNLRWQIKEGSPLDLTLQLNFRSGNSNDRHRFGLRWRLNNTKTLESFFSAINLAWSMNFHLLQIDKEDPHVWQIEHAFRMTFPALTKRLYLAGFIDHTFNQDLGDQFPSSPIVGEAQLGFQVVDNLYAITEYRVNQYRRSDVNNLAVGFEYIIKW